MKQNTEALRSAADKYKLKGVAFFKHPKQGWVIIKREGIETIQRIEDIKVTYEPIAITEKFCVIKATAIKGDEKVESFGEADRDSNCRQTFPVAIAEKRALSRVVLKLSGLYEEGYKGEEEMDADQVKETEPVEEKK